jgi:hypothetical protein
MSGCRDCSRCTESAIWTLLLLPLRICIWFLTIWNIRLFQRYCPECHHPMNRHRMVRGRFQD